MPRRLFLLALLAAGCGPGRAANPVALKELEPLILGKSADEARSILGPPDHITDLTDTQGRPTGEAVWFYKDRIATKDGKRKNAHVRVVNGRVSGVQT